MSANSYWLKAYEAQKAKALLGLKAAKNGDTKDTNVLGLSGSIPSKTKVNSSKNSTTCKVCKKIEP